ncbi:hypothetical protein Lal_00036643 [Lupinus albus]|nr:hypothetical protein Lal_00036643 [Lupinus albus]
MQECVVFAPQLIIILMCALLCLSQELVIILRLMLLTSTTIDLHISSNIMIHPHQAHTILNRPSYVPPPIEQQRHQMFNTPASTEPSLEELVRQMTMQNMQFQQETRASIQRQESSFQNLTTQIGQMATSLKTLQSHNSDKLPSQTMLNPRNVSAITLKSGK